MRDPLRAFKFSPVSGKPLEYKGGNLLAEKVGDFHWYLEPLPANSAIILNEEKQLMLAKRALNPQKSKWDLPGGFLELNETFEESVIREVREELGVLVSGDQLEYFKSYKDRYRHCEIDYYVTAASFIVHMTEMQIEKLSVADDVSEIRWFKLDSIPFEDIGFKSIKQAVQDFISTTK